MFVFGYKRKLLWAFNRFERRADAIYRDPEINGWEEGEALEPALATYLNEVGDILFEAGKHPASHVIDKLATKLNENAGHR